MRVDPYAKYIQIPVHVALILFFTASYQAKIDTTSF